MSLLIFKKMYFILSKSYKAFVRYLFNQERVNRKNNIKAGVFFKRQRIADREGRCKKTVQRFNKAVKDLLFEIKERFDPNGRQTTNVYFIKEEFYKALVELDLMNKLYVSRKEGLTYTNMLDSIEERHEKCPPPPPQKCPPSSQIPSLSQKHIRVLPKPQRVHFALEKVGKISQEVKEILSLYPDHAIIGGIEACARFVQRGYKIKTTIEQFLGAEIARRAGSRPYLLGITGKGR